MSTTPLPDCTHPPVCILLALVVVPDAETSHQHLLVEVDREGVVLTVHKRDQPHVLIRHRHVRTVYHPRMEKIQHLYFIL